MGGDDDPAQEAATVAAEHRPRRRFRRCQPSCSHAGSGPQPFQRPGGSRRYQRWVGDGDGQMDQL